MRHERIQPVLLFRLYLSIVSAPRGAMKMTRVTCGVVGQQQVTICCGDELPVATWLVFVTLCTFAYVRQMLADVR